MIFKDYRMMHNFLLYNTKLKYVEGDVDDYMVSGPFANDFIFNKFVYFTN